MTRRVKMARETRLEADACSTSGAQGWSRVYKAAAGVTRRSFTTLGNHRAALKSTVGQATRVPKLSGSGLGARGGDGRGNLKCGIRRVSQVRSATCYDMAHSLSSECTPLKHAYDSCFNAWFAGYLEPTLTPHQQRERDRNPQEYQKQKAEEYQRKCGKVWESYRECVQVSAFGGPLRALLPSTAHRRYELWYLTEISLAF